jgi:uncharacterized protein
MMPCGRRCSSASLEDCLQLYDMRTEEFAFAVGCQRLAATRVLSGSGRPPEVVSFHGLGVTASRARIRYLLDGLARHGLSSICFDFSGNGDSTGQLEKSNLRARATESLAAANLLAGSETRAIVGTSMGAHLAALVSQAVRPRSLVLFCPAAYSDQVSDLNFDESFTCRPGRLVTAETHAKSSALRALLTFTGNLLIIAATEDKVIPREVIDLYVVAASRARSRRVIWLEGCDHFVHPWLEHHETQRSAVLHAVLSATVDQGGGTQAHEQAT